MGKKKEPYVCKKCGCSLVLPGGVFGCTRVLGANICEHCLKKWEEAQKKAFEVWLTRKEDDNP